MKKKCKQRLDVEFLSKVGEIGFGVANVRGEVLNICFQTVNGMSVVHSYEDFLALARQFNKDGTKFKVSFTYMKTYELFDRLIFG